MRRHIIGLFTSSVVLATAPVLFLACGNSEHPSTTADGGAPSGDDASAGAGSDAGSPSSEGGAVADGSTGSSGDGGVRADGGVSSCAPADVFLGASSVVVGGNLTHSYVVGDVNNDGLDDIVQSNGASPGAFQVILNQGGGKFAAPVQNAGPQTGLGQAAGLGDIDGDGYLDFLYEAPTSDNGEALVVALNNKNGTFASGTIVDVPSVPEVVLTADVNNDGKQDALVSLQNGGAEFQLAVMLNSGAKLGAPTVIDTPVDDDEGNTFATGDLNGDGNLDIATYDGVKGPCVVLGVGDGAFGTKTCYPGSPGVLEVQGISVADLNGDEKPEIIVFNYNEEATAISLFTNKGDGTFGSVVPLAIPTGHALFGGRVADMNNDGKADLVLSARIDDIVFVMSGKGDGTFGAPEVFALGDPSNGGGQLVLGDFLGNGLPGLLTDDNGYSSTSAQSFDVLAATCRRTIPAPATLLADGGAPASTCAPSKVTISTAVKVVSTSTDGALRAIDLDGDKKADLVQLGGSSASKAFSALMSNGDGTFKTAVEVAGSVYGLGIAVGDVNGDGFADVLFATTPPVGSEGVGVALNTGAGTFATPIAVATSNAFAESSVMELADLDNDGHLDLLTDGTLQLGRGDGSFELGGTPTAFYVEQTTRPYRAVDLNGDLQLDVVTLNGTANGPGYCSALNIGNGNFAPQICGSTGGPADHGQAIAAGDLNADGFADVVVAYEEQAAGLYVYLGKGDGTFQAPKTANLPQINATQIELGDFNNDGHADLVVYFPGTNQLTVLTGAGDGTFPGTPKSYAVGGAPFNPVIAVGDFAGNGLLGFAIGEGTKKVIDVFTATCSP